ncbi:MAG: hypothetical protein HGA67_00570 [Candidatus Yonathbacteria bacterium]|nr:hypothetical protein [Candidatus Yonathbacteria bacterium]
MNTQRGFIQFVLIIIVIIVILGYFGFNLRDIMETPAVKDNLSFVWQAVVDLWDNWLREPVVWFWNTVWVPYIWQPFVHVMDSLKADQAAK